MGTGDALLVAGGMRTKGKEVYLQGVQGKID